MQISSEAQTRGKRSTLVAGVGAAAIAAVLTVIWMSAKPASVTETRSAASSKECHMVARRLLVSTTHGGGTVRFKASGYVSPSFTLTSQPQALVFPLPRPTSEPVEEQITIEGDATDLVLTSEVSELHKVFEAIHGEQPFRVLWKPNLGC